MPIKSAAQNAKTNTQTATHTDGSELGISIMGSIVKDKGNPDDNVALIKEKAGSVRAVKKDHVIQDKFKVIAITKDYIDVITREGRHYFVYQDKFAAEGAKKSEGTHSTTPTLSVLSSYKEDGFERNQAKIVMTGMYRDKVVKEDLAKILMQATAEPYFENGQIVGFKMSQIDEGSLYHKSGLLDGDVITAVNNQELNSVAGSIALLQKLKTADHIEVDVKRGGQITKMSIDVR